MISINEKSDYNDYQIVNRKKNKLNKQCIKDKQDKQDKLNIYDTRKYVKNIKNIRDVKDKKINIKINKNYEYGKGILYNDSYSINNYCLIKHNQDIKIVEIKNISIDKFNYISNIDVSDLDYNTYSFKPILGSLYPLYSSPFLSFYKSKLGRITLDYINEYPPCGYYMGYGYMNDDICYENGYIYETNKWNKTEINNKLLRYSIGLKNLNEKLNHSYISIKVYKHEKNETTKEFNKKKKYWLNRCNKWLLQKEKNGNLAYYNYKRNQFLRKVIKYYKQIKENKPKQNKIKETELIENKENKELNNINNYIMDNNSDDKYNYVDDNGDKYDIYGNKIEETKEEKEERLYREDFEYRAHHDPFTMSMLHFMSRKYPNGQSIGWSKMDDEFLESIGLKETDEKRLEKIKLKNNEKKNIQIKKENEKKMKNKNNNINDYNDNYEEDYDDNYDDNYDDYNENDY